MPSYTDAMASFTKDMDEMNIHYHLGLYHAITKHLGPSIYDRDASLVACSDPSELATIKKNFLIKKLGMEDSEDLDTVIHEICDHLGQSNRQKHRTTFYYLLVARLGKESVFIGD